MIDTQHKSFSLRDFLFSFYSDKLLQYLPTWLFSVAVNHYLLKLIGRGDV